MKESTIVGIGTTVGLSSLILSIVIISKYATEPQSVFDFFVRAFAVIGIMLIVVIVTISILSVFADEDEYKHNKNIYKF